MWSTWRGPPDPGRLSKLCASRAACPRRFARRCGLRGGDHPLSEQVGEENRGIAFWARPSDAYRSAKQVAGFTATDADEPVAARAALVDRVRRQCFAVLECLAHTGQVDREGLMAEPV